MCGIFGVIAHAGARALDERRFAAALQTLSHRGPNGQLWQRVDETTLLGHTRLSIIDLTAHSNQPMVADDRYWLVYNGEVFNYLELRQDLMSRGVRFDTTGDVEVVLKAYIHWGASCVERFNGMWALAIYDRLERTLFCSRDRYGEKPFNYAMIDGQFMFASEINAMLSYEPKLAEPDYNVIANFCRTSTGAQHAQTWFAKVQRLQPGHNLILHNGKAQIWRYWQYPPQARQAGSNFAEAREEYRRLFVDSVRVRMRSDVPLGVTLSAGLDSNSIAYAMQAIDPVAHHCFTSRFLPGEGLARDKAIYVDGGGAIDESISARKVAGELGLESHVVDTDYQEFVAPLTRIVRHLESGNSSPAVFPLMQLLGKAREHVTVLLDGQGADELLGGYVANIIWQSVADLVSRGRFAEARATINQYGETYTLPYSVLMALRGASNRWPAIARWQQRMAGTQAAYGPLLERYTKQRDYPDLNDPAETSWVGAVLRQQHSGGLVNLLHYGDAISMANSLESRMPFLDHRLVDFVWSLPPEFKVKLGVGKHLHREAMRGLVPDWIIDNRTKFGFNSPIATQFRKRFERDEDPVDVLLGDRCMSRGLFDRKGLSALIAAHRSEVRDHSPLLYRMLSTELWFREFIDGEP